VHGATADEMLHAGSDDPAAIEDMVNPQITIAQAFRRRNLATFRNLAQQKMQQLEAGGGSTVDGGTDDSQQWQGTTTAAAGSSSLLQPLHVQGLRVHNSDADAHILFFDVEALIGQSVLNKGDCCCNSCCGMQAPSLL